MIRLAPRPPSDPARRPHGARGVPWPGLLLFATGFAVRALYTWLALGRHPIPVNDGISYDEIGWNLARGVGFHVHWAAGTYPTAFRPPLYPFLISLVYRAVGHDVFLALVAQCALGGLLPVLLASFARATFGSSVARIAGLLAAIHPMLIFFSAYLLTETTFAFVMLLALAASADWVKTPRPARALGAGLLWGAAVLTRPNALLLPPLVAAWAWVPLGLTVTNRDRLRQVALLAAGVALVVAPWTLRNARVMHAFVPVTTGGGRALFDANNPLIWTDPARRGGAESVYNIEPWASRYRGLDEVQADRLSGEMAVDFLRAHVAQWPTMAVAKLGRFWRLTSEGGALTGRWQASGSALARLRGRLDPLLGWSLLILPLAIWGAVRSLAGPKALFLSLPLLVIGAFTLTAVVYWGALRMRVPIEPLVVLYAAAGADDLRRRWRMRRSGLSVVPAP
ncbi:MAG TPA: glycosyltransferase family 39 protein [Candidatus Acidoferrales bacterium]|nr:glycosyltransferase family 39 protein [Candidatus Acidoferrales bacterium]